MPAREVCSADELEPVAYRLRSDGIAEVSLRRDIERRELPKLGGEDEVGCEWYAHEVSFACRYDERDVTARFDDLWAEHAAEEPTAAQMAQTIAEQDAAICELYEMMEAKEVGNG